MSQENVEIVRRAYEAAVRRPTPDFATVNALFHTDHELVTTASQFEGGSARGAQGFREWLESFGEAWESWDISVEEGRSIGDERVLVVVVFKVVGRHSGVPVEQRVALVVTVRDGKVTRTDSYTSPQDALEAVGLAE